MFVAKTVGLPCFGLVFIGKIRKLEALVQQVGFGHRSFAGWVHGLKDTPVFTQDVVYVTHKLILVRILLVKVRSAALIAAILLVSSSVKFVSAFDACSFFH